MHGGNETARRIFLRATKTCEIRNFVFTNRHNKLFIKQTLLMYLS